MGELVGRFDRIMSERWSDAFVRLSLARLAFEPEIIMLGVCVQCTFAYGRRCTQRKVKIICKGSKEDDLFDNTMDNLAPLMPTADDSASRFSDPTALAGRVAGFDEVSRDLRDHRLKRCVPTIFSGIKHPMAMGNPRHVANARLPEFECGRLWHRITPAMRENARSLPDRTDGEP